MNSVLITGANRGLGLGMVKYLIQQNKAEKIIATCRNASEELNQLSQDNKNLHIVNLDVKNMQSFDDVTGIVTNVVGEKGLNLLINNAGISTKFTKLNLVKMEQLQENLTVNTIAPIMLTKSMLPLLKKGASNSGAIIINMSSILGSIAQNDQGGFYPYRCSKAALNAATKSMSVDLKKENIVVASLHPGWVKTDMGGKAAPLDVTTSVAGIFSTIEKLSAADSGKFLQYDGSELPW